MERKTEAQNCETCNLNLNSFNEVNRLKTDVDRITAMLFPKNCKEIDQIKAAVGTECITSKGFVFKRIQDENNSKDGAILRAVKTFRFGKNDGLGWQDTASGIVMYDLKLKKAHDHYDTAEFCAGHGLELPSGYDERFNGFREIFKDFDDDFFWSSSISLFEYDNRKGANLLGAAKSFRNPNVIKPIFSSSFSRDRDRYDHSVRCVARH